MANQLRQRQYTIQLLFLICSILLIIKAMDLQLIDDQFRERADATTIDEFTLYPSRGLIYDRNDSLLVNPKVIYDIMVVYNQIDSDMDTAKFCKLLNIDQAYFEKALDKNWRSQRYSKSVPFTFASKISKESYVRFSESLYEFPGFYGVERFVRSYEHQGAAHLLGYIREVNQKELALDHYQLGDYIGASGLELAYEDTLRGDKGERIVLKDNLGRVVDEYNSGKNNIPPMSGKNLVSTIDFNLQSYGEQLMRNKIGSIVAIQPQTGEVLAMVSSPTYDPNLLTINRNRGKAYKSLEQDSLNPFFDRNVMAQYPPGSLFKPVVALIAMQTVGTPPDRTISCSGAYFHQGRRLTGCHGHATCFSIDRAIQHSCNTYFVTLFRDIVDQYGFYKPEVGLDTFNYYLDQFGMGRPLGIDFPREKGGNFPTSSYFSDKVYKGENWNSIWLRSLGIGQGELLMTNLQMANLAAIIGNKGYYKIPHLVKGFRVDGDTTISYDIPERFTRKNRVGIDTIHFEPVINGMEKVVSAGTAAASYIYDIPFCGKTGTAENNQRNAKDHSIFFGFAPKENPQIAIAVYVENGGFGATYAAPIASLMIEKYIKGEIRPFRKYLETRMMNANLIVKP